MPDQALPLEIERKFLIAMPSDSFLKSLRRVSITQTYLISSDGEKRVRRIEENGTTRYVKTVKIPVTNLTRIEREEEVDEEAYESLLTEADPDCIPLSKTRYFLPHGNLCFEIDVYPFWSDCAVMEVELPSENAPVILPQEITLIKEITGDPAYKNARLACKRA